MRGQIAIVGGGPAGAMAAEILVRNGRPTVLFDEKLAWEKPCGGGVTPKTLDLYPFLRDTGVERNWVNSCELISPAGYRLEFELNPKIAIFSRRVLNGMMLDRARKAGVEIIHQRVTGIEGSPGNWRLVTPDGPLWASFLVIACGARNPFRARFSRPFSPSDLMATAGYYIPGSSHRMTVRFLAGVEGYIWTFPRRDHFSAGICGRMNGVATAQLRKLLENFLRDEGFRFDGAPFYAHILPSPGFSLLSAPVCGEGWAMVGDAAGYVDSITGEGLYYAFRSGELCANALLSGHPDSYAVRVREDFLHELVTAAALARRFFCGEFMGAPVTERLVRMASYSDAFRSLLRRLFAGSQGYADMRERGYRMLPRVLFGTGWPTLAESA